MISAKLVGVTMPFGIEGCDLPEHLISYCTRVSNPDNQLNFETADKLIGYCIRHQHWSILEMVNVVMEIEAPRDISRQLLRHDFRFQELSQRYAEIQDTCSRECRFQHPTNRQSSIEVDWENAEQLEIQRWWDIAQQKVLEHALGVYETALEKGVAKEVARTVLPEGLTMSRLYANGTVRNWYHYCQLRVGNGTQKEHQTLALYCRAEILLRFPSLNNHMNN